MIISEWLFSQKCRFCQLQISTKVQKVPWTLISWQVFKETKCQLKFWHHSGNAINSGRGRRLKTSWTEKEQVAWRLQHWSNTNWVVGQQQKNLQKDFNQMGMSDWLIISCLSKSFLIRILQLFFGSFPAWGCVGIKNSQAHTSSSKSDIRKCNCLESSVLSYALWNNAQQEWAKNVENCF